MPFGDKTNVRWFEEPFSPEEVAMLLRAGTAAPSLYNSQPWRFVITGHEVSIFADPQRKSPIADPEGRQQVIACGAALLNIRLAIRSLGYQTQVSLWPDGKSSDHLVTVRRGGPMEQTAADRKLFAQIHQRHTNREQFGSRSIIPAARQILRYEAGTEGAWLRPIDSAADRGCVINLLVRAIRAQRSNHALAVEMAQWLHSEVSVDGMPIAAWRGAEFPVPGLDDGIGIGVGNWEQAIGKLVRAHTFFILATSNDRPVDWLVAGQALQRSLLSATQLQLAASFFNQIVESPPLRSELVERLGMPAHPQMMLRVGYPAHRVRATGRRALDAVLDEPTPSSI